MQNDGLMESVTPGESHSRLTGWLDTAQPFTLMDDTAGDRLEVAGPFSGIADLLGADWGNPNVEAGYWNPSNRQYFLLGPDRSGHSFLAQSGWGYSLVTKGGEFALDAGDGSTQMRYEFSAAAYGSDFRLIDLATLQRSPAGELDLALAAWEPNPTALPATMVYLFFDPAQVGQTFTVHSRASGGSEQLQSITVQAFTTQPGSWHIGGMDESYLYTTDHTGASVTIPSGVGLAQVTVGFGMEFWLTRAGAISSPTMLVPSLDHGLQWLLFGTVPPPPPPALTDTTFRMPTSGGHIEHADGTQATLEVVSTGWIYAYDDLGNVSDLTEYAMARASVDNSQGWWFVGAAGGMGADHATDVLDWHPSGHDTPPEVDASNIEVIFSPQSWGNVQLVQDGWSFPIPYDSGWSSTTMWNGYTFAPVNYGGAQFFTYEGVDGDGQWLYSVPCVRVWVPYDASKPFKLVGMNYGTGADESSPSNTTDLHSWLPTAPRTLTISSSRWDHDLWLVQPDGSQSRVVQGALQGDFSIGDAGAAWWNGYYQFLSSAPCKEGLDWRIEDRTTDEASTHFSAGAGTDLGAWHSVVAPTALSLIGKTGSSIAMRWSPGVAAEGGSFEIERREAEGSIAEAPWRLATELAAIDAEQEAGYILYKDHAVSGGITYQYRVRNHFGVSHSAPSNVLTVTIPLDSDDDGLSDADEALWGTDPNNPDTDGDGMPDGYEVLHNLNPNAADGDSDLDEDGMSNVREYYFGLNPSNGSDNPGSAGNSNLQQALTNPNQLIPLMDLVFPVHVTGSGQIAPKNTVLPIPLTVELHRRSSAGALWPGESVTFSQAGYGGGFATSANATEFSPTLTLNAGTDGRAKAWYRLPDMYGLGAGAPFMPRATGSGSYVNFTVYSFIRSPEPVFTPVGILGPKGELPLHSGVKIAHAITAATIRYTIDGSEPTATSPVIAAGGIIWKTGTFTLRAKAWVTLANGLTYDPSATVSKAYTFQFTGEGLAHWYRFRQANFVFSPLRRHIYGWNDSMPVVVGLSGGCQLLNAKNRYVLHPLVDDEVGEVYFDGNDWLTANSTAIAKATAMTTFIAGTSKRRMPVPQPNDIWPHLFAIVTTPLTKAVHGETDGGMGFNIKFRNGVIENKFLYGQKFLSTTTGSDTLAESYRDGFREMRTIKTPSPTPLAVPATGGLIAFGRGASCIREVLIYRRALSRTEQKEVEVYLATLSGIPLQRLADTDGDEIPDWKELELGTKHDNVDSDGDGLTDTEEVFSYRTDSTGVWTTDTEKYFTSRTDPKNWDTDGDMMSDEFEAHTLGFNPILSDANADPDGDGLKNFDEMIYCSDPTKWDTDGDGFNDRQESEIGTDPNDPLDKPEIIQTPGAPAAALPAAATLPNSALKQPPGHVWMRANFGDDSGSHSEQWQGLLYELDAQGNLGRVVWRPMTSTFGEMYPGTLSGSNRLCRVMKAGKRYAWTTKHRATKTGYQTDYDLKVTLDRADPPSPDGTPSPIIFLIDGKLDHFATTYGTSGPTTTNSAEGARIPIDLLPVEVKEAWSDQLPDVKVNFMPNGTGWADKPYIFMSVRADGKAYAKAKVAIGGPPELRNKILWRIAKSNGSGGYTPMSGDSSYDASGEVVTIIRDFPDDDPDQNYILVVGYDQDGDNYLSTNEANITPTCKHKPPGQNAQPQTLPFTFKVVSKPKYDASATICNSIASRWSGLGWSNASDLLAKFTAGANPTFDAPALLTDTIDRLGVDSRGVRHGLTHPVGVLFTPVENPGATIRAQYPATSAFTRKYLDSTTFINKCSEFLKKKKTDVQARFRGSENVTEVFTWNDFDDSIDFSNSSDLELWFAIGHGTYDLTMQLVVNRFDLTVETMTINGHSRDLYDFDVDAAVGRLDFEPAAARRQAGYNTAGTGGRVITTELLFQNGEPHGADGLPIPWVIGWD